MEENENKENELSTSEDIKSEPSQEAKEEEKVVETPVQEDKTVEPEVAEDGVYNESASMKDASSVYVNATGKVPANAEDLSEALEGTRQAFVKTYKSSRIGTTICLSIFGVFIIATLITYFIMSQNENKTLFYCLVFPFLGVSVISFIVYLVLSWMGKKKYQASVEDYINTWTDSLVSSIYANHEDVTNASFSATGKVDDWSIINTHYFATINSIDSRSHIAMDYCGYALCDTEVSISVPHYSDFVNRIALERVVPAKKIENSESTETEEPKPSSVAPTDDTRGLNIGGYGKFISCGIKAPEPNDYLIVVKKISNTYLPTNVHGLVNFENVAAELLGEDYVVWSSSEEFARSVLSEDNCNLMKSIPTGSALYDWFFTFNKDGASFMLNCSADIMTMPLYDRVKPEIIKVYFDSANITMDVFKNLISQYSENK